MDAGAAAEDGWATIEKISTVAGDRKLISAAEEDGWATMQKICMVAADGKQRERTESAA